MPTTPRSHRPPKVESVGDYFFERGDPRRPRRELVRRDELYQVLEWYHEHAIRRNRWWHRFARAVMRRSFTELNPFAWIRLRRETAGTEGGEA